MENRTVGYIIIIIAVLMAFITYSFNQALKDIVDSICTHGDACPMVQSIDFQTNVSISIITFVFLLGIYFILSSKPQQSPTSARAKSEHDIEKVLSTLSEDERKVYEIIKSKGGKVYQSSLPARTGYSKVKITRILDKMESKGLIERVRKGMSNMIVLKLCN